MTVADLVRRERARLRAALLTWGAGSAFAAMAAVLAAAVVALGSARWITRPALPLAAWGTAVVLAAAVLLWTGRQARRGADTRSVARAIERERGLRAGAVRGVLEVGESGALGRYAAAALARRLADAGGVLAPAAQRRALRRGWAAALAAVLALAALGAARASAPDGWRALRHPVGAFTGALLPRIAIVDAPRLVMRGERLRVHVLAPERRTVTLQVRTTGAPWDARTLAVRGGEALTELGPLDADVTLVAEDGRMTSDTVRVRVTDRPFVGDVAIRATYPAYLRRRPEAVPLGEPARVPRGTVLSVTGRASVALAGIGLAQGSDTLRFVPDGHAFAGRLAARQSGRWGWFAAGELGPVADLPSPLELEVIPDSAPRIAILSPPRDTAVLADARVTLRVMATDDHGLADVVLRTTRRLADGRAMPALTQAVASPAAPQWTGEVPLDLALRGLMPGDELRVVAVATDASPWRQEGASEELVLRIPSLTEQRERARALGDSTVARVQRAAAGERTLAERTSEAARSRVDRSTSSDGSRDGATSDSTAAHDMSYRSAEQARQLARAQQQLQQQVQQAQRDAAELARQLRAAGVMDSALMQRLRDAQQMLREALTPELQKQLQDVLKAAQQLSPEEARRALQNLAEGQRKLREALEHSAEMLKRAALEGSMQTLHDEARDIARAEHAVADSLARRERSRDPAADSRTARDAAQLAKRSRDLARDVGDAAQRLEQDHAQSGPERLRGARASADSSAGGMQRAASLDSGSAAAQRQASAAQAAQHMDQAAQQLAQARQSQIQEWKQQLTSELDRSIQETMQLARSEQRLAERARAGSDQGLRADQSDIQQGVQRLQERLEQAARTSAHVTPRSQAALGEASRSVQRATRAAADGERRGPGAERLAQQMDQASQALDRAAAQMMRDRSSAASGQTASGFAEMIEAMREAAKEQGGINGQSAGLMPVPGGQPSAEMLAQGRALAQRERALAQKLENAAGGGAEELTKEMRQIADALERGRLDPSLLDREQRLFHRLLDNGLTLQKDEREDQGKREAQTARDTAIVTGTVSSGRSAFRYQPPTWDQLRDLTADERRAVLEYFRRINGQQQP